MWCTLVYLKVPLVALVSASWVNGVQKNPRYHPLNVVTSAPLSGRASAPWMEPGECGAWLEGLVALPVAAPQKREKLRRVPTMRRFRRRNCWSSRSTQWPSTTGALAPWLSSASRASVLSFPTGSLCNGEWGTWPWGRAGRGSWRKKCVLPSLSCQFTCSHLSEHSQAGPDASEVCVPKRKSCWDPACGQSKLQKPREVEQLSGINIFEYNTI